MKHRNGYVLINYAKDVMRQYKDYVPNTPEKEVELLVIELELDIALSRLDLYLMAKKGSI